MTGRECYELIDQALDVARQLLCGDLAPSRELAESLNKALLDETRLPWAVQVTISA